MLCYVCKPLHVFHEIVSRRKKGFSILSHTYSGVAFLTFLGYKFNVAHQRLRDKLLMNLDVAILCSEREYICLKG